jgi:hypothetical protein
MDFVDALCAECHRDIPYASLVEAMTPFLHPAALEELVVIMFHLRNVRGGKGKRQLFRDMMNVFYDYDRDLVKLLLPLIPEYGYWKDVFYLSMTLPHLLESTKQMCAQQLLHDEYRMRLGYAPSLMAKYIPKQKKKYKSFASSFAQHLYPEITCHSLRMRNMRKRISALNSRTVEVKMCAGQWASIEPAAVPVLARKRYERALLNEGVAGAQRTESEDRIACREKFLTFLHSYDGGKEPLTLTTASEQYAPVRAAVQFWIASGLNMNH